MTGSTDSVVVGVLEKSATGGELASSRAADLQHLANRLILRAGSLTDHELGWRLAVRAISMISPIFPAETTYIHRFESGAAFSAPLGDGYYAGLQVPDGTYEEEMIRALDLLASDNRIFFVDGGSNRGFFPSYLSTKLAGGIAFEAADRMANWIEVNLALNAQCPVNLRRNALWSNSGELLSFSTHDRLHPGGGISSVSHAVEKSSESTEWTVNEVETLTIDDALAHSADWQSLSEESDVLLVIKLDVEGAELEALKGSQSALAHERTILLYEQHSSDYNDAVYEYVASHGMMQFMMLADGLQEVRSFDDVRPFLDSKESLGFNILACNSSLAGLPLFAAS